MTAFHCFSRTKLITKLMPLITSGVSAVPLQLATRTECRTARFATPDTLPTARPATCVPWPWQSTSAFAQRSSASGGSLDSSQNLWPP